MRFSRLLCTPSWLSLLRTLPKSADSSAHSDCGVLQKVLSTRSSSLFMTDKSLSRWFSVLPSSSSSPLSSSSSSSSSSPSSSHPRRRFSFAAPQSVSGSEPPPLPTPTTHHRFTVERIDHRRKEHVFEVVDLASDAVNRADNVGLDEFPSADELQENLSNDVIDLFVVRESSASRRLLAAILIEPCKAARTIRPEIASISLVTSREISRQPSELREIARLSYECVAAVNRGYVSCTVAVFDVCFLTLNAWLSQDFVVTACLPLTGQLKQTAVTPGKKNGKYTLSYLLYKKLKSAVSEATQIESHDSDGTELVAFANAICSKELTHSDDDEMVARWSRGPSFDFLPATFGLPSCGYQVTVRMIRGEADIERYYKTFLAAATAGHGFRLEEIPTHKYFTWLYSQYWNCVIEDTATGQWIAVMCIAPSPFSRDRLHAKTCDGSIIIAPGYRQLRCGLSIDVIQVWSYLSVDAGFEAGLADTSFDNMGVIRSCLIADFIAVGSLPGAMFSRDPNHCSDVILMSKFFRNTPSLKTFVSQQQQQKR